MAGKSSAYSYKNVSVVVNGQQVQGLFDGDDAVVVAPMEDEGTMLVGADGSSLFSQSANEAVTITLRLQHTSPTHRLLSQQRARQRTPGIKLVGFPVSVIDVDSNEGGSTSEAFIMTAPEDAKGVAAATREWVLVAGQWKPEIPFA